MGATTMRDRRSRGFTLIELSIVLLIIGLLMAFILAASQQGVTRAQVRATQSLIAKLDGGVADRIEALLSQRVEPNDSHQFLAAIYPPIPASGFPAPGLPWGLKSDARAAVIAMMDMLRSELPDTFYIPATTDLEYDPAYPINFAGLPFPLTSAARTTSPKSSAYVVPITNLDRATYPPYLPNSFAVPGNGIIPPTLPYDMGPGTTQPMGAPLVVASNQAADSGFDGRHPVKGVYGATFTARASLMKNLGNVPAEALTGGLLPLPLLPAGLDGVDNNGNGLIDEIAEGVDATNSGQVMASLANHTQITARAEMLYALLVEGAGPLGSVFSRDDFTDKEVQDTDKDGLPEFVDAWGQPLQFYRWPVAYSGNGLTTDLQRGAQLYNGRTDTRQQSQLDANQALLTPGWWWDSSNSGFVGATGGSDQFPAPLASTATLGMPSGRAYGVQRYFGPLVELNAADPNVTTFQTNGQLWDRGGYYARRAYFSKYLIVSSGPDQLLGIAQLGTSLYSQNGASGASNVPVTAQALITIENAAAREAPIRQANPPFYTADATSSDVLTIRRLLGDWGQDDITNHNLQTPTGATQ